MLERHFRIDDPVGAIAVHGVCGIWGALAVGIFADGSYGDGWNAVAGPVRGILYGDAGQLIAQTHRRQRQYRGGIRTGALRSS